MLYLKYLTLSSLFFSLLLTLFHRSGCFSVRLQRAGDQSFIQRCFSAANADGLRQTPARAWMGEGVRMDNLLDFGGLCPSSRREWDTSSCVDELMDEDEKDRAKRASRNKSEKKRRDQFNVLIKELCTMLQGQGHPRKMDKSTILQRTIDFLQKQKEITAQTEMCEIRQDWKPSFLSNEEFTQLMLEALDGFLIALTTDGNIIYVSDSVSSLIGHLPSDMVDQNILNFLPELEHGEVYKLLSSHMLMTDPLAADFLDSESHVEFCCHLARGNIDPKEPSTYEYVKFVGDFKFHNNVPTSSCNGFELALPALPRTLQSSLEEQACLVATVRLVTPQFLKDLCNVEDPCDEFTSRHSLEWKFLFLDHRASPIIGYLPFEVLGTSGYDYYHVDDLELIAQCHKQLMQFGKGKSCYYRFLTKGQQWIWLQTHYYITYHQWNSKPEFIVCTHTVVSYAEVRAERRREFGLEETSPPEIATSIKGQEVYLDVCPTLEPQRDRTSGACSVSSHSSRKSSHTALSDSASNSSVRYPEACTPSRQPASVGTEKTPTRRLQPSSSKTLVQRQNSFDVPQLSLPLSPACSQHSAMQQQQQQPLCPLQPPQLGLMHQLKEPQLGVMHQLKEPQLGVMHQLKEPQLGVMHQLKEPQLGVMHQLKEPQLGVMHQLKEQLEERTRVLQADIKTQQQELHDIKEKLQLANLQMLLQQPIHTDFGQVQQPQQQGPGRPTQQSQTQSQSQSQNQSQSQSGVIRQASGHSKQPICGGHSSSPQSLLREHSSPSPQVQQRQVSRGQVQTVTLPVQTHTSLTLPFYSNPMMFSQTNARPLQDTNQRHSDNEFSQDGQIRMLLNQQMQTLVPDSSVSSQASQCNSGIQQTKHTLEQQMMTPSFPMQQLNCNAVLVPSPVFTSPIMIPHNGFITHQAQPAYHAQPAYQAQGSQHALQLQQPQQFFQMQPQGLIHSGGPQAFFHTTNVQQQSTVGYIQQQQQQQQPQQQPRHHSQNQTGSLSDFRNMLTR
ncbi:neuronal PAS domain-containing protein 2 isoform X2 [Osmerus mordax]|uniref:neuronal PAS domain-containing protein 2 isoform X2 n=1 Tax=Osmerus mordax TaxID=8014 RepID=UPI00351019EF